MKARLTELTGAIHGALCSLTPRQRGAARRALNKLTTANCAWHVYAMRPVLHEMLAMASSGRERKARAKKEGR